MATMERRKTMTMNFEGLVDDDDDQFFETFNRLSTVDPMDLASSSDEDEDFDDPRTSFSSTISSVHTSPFRAMSRTDTISFAAPTTPKYDIWMAEPGSITERRKKLLGKMGLDENKVSIKVKSMALDRLITKRLNRNKTKGLPPPLPSSSTTNSSPSPQSTNSAAPVTDPQSNSNSNPGSNSNTNSNSNSDSPSNSNSDSKPPSDFRSPVPVEVKIEQAPVSSVSYGLVRSRSEGDIESFSMAKMRKEELIGKVSKQRLTRTSTEITKSRARIIPMRVVVRDSVEAGEPAHHAKKVSASAAVMAGPGGVGAFFLIKNLDTGKEFIVNEYNEDGMWNRLSDLQTGKQLTMEEFEKTVGHSEIVKELMRRAKVVRRDGLGKKLSSSSYISRSLRMSKRTGSLLLKNIKDVATGIVGEKEKEASVQQNAEQQKPQAKNEWVKVRQSGKSSKELSALHLCQEFHAHEGCVWTLKFSLDGRFLASAGEDKVIHVWEVQECEVMSMKPEEGNLTPIHSSLLPPSAGQEASPLSADKKKKGKFGSRKGSPIPDYVHVPENVFTLSDKPYCTLEGHLDEVLDMCWSKSQQLLSSSMDKTVRLWDMETKTCLKFFAHNDYVTCIHFNPIDDNYFISGSLDAKVRIWNIPARLVVDWTDIHEMVTAVSYTPDGQGVFVGTQNGSCKTYNVKDDKLTQTGTIEIGRKKKSLLKKVTGFQFAPNNPSEVLVTTGDCRIRIVNGSEVAQKYKGFRNANSQIAASFSTNGRYIVSASEDSNVYVWKHEEPRSPSNGKARSILVVQSHEQFPCKDVSVAITWPGTIKGDPPPSLLGPQSKTKSKRITTPPAAPSTRADDNNTPATNSKSTLPPLPKKGKKQATVPAAAAPSSPADDGAAISQPESGNEDSVGNSTPEKKNDQATTDNNDSTTPSAEEDPEASSRTETGLGDSVAEASASNGDGDSAAITAAATPPAASCSSDAPNDTSHGAPTPTVNPSAWGLVIVTAGFGGEIRCYQNFGLPRKTSLQANLFGGPA